MSKHISSIALFLKGVLKDAPMWIVRLILAIIMMTIACFIGWIVGMLIPPVVTLYTVAVLGMVAFFGLMYLGFYYLFRHTLAELWVYLDHRIVLFFKGEEIRANLVKVFGEMFPNAEPQTV